MSKNDRLVGDQSEISRRQASEALALVDAFEASAPLAFGFIDTEFGWCASTTRWLASTVCPPKGIWGGQWPTRCPSYGPCSSRTTERSSTTETRSTSCIPSGRDADGRETVWFTKYFPVRVEGQLAGIGIVGVDITETKQSERFRSAVLDTMAEGLYALDARDE